MPLLLPYYYKFTLIYSYIIQTLMAENIITVFLLVQDPREPVFVRFGRDLGWDLGRDLRFWTTFIVQKWRVFVAEYCLKMA